LRLPLDCGRFAPRVVEDLAETFACTRDVTETASVDTHFSGNTEPEFAIKPFGGMAAGDRGSLLIYFR